MSWTRTDAIDLLTRVQPKLNELGYVAALHGSVLTDGAGDDLDLALIGTDDSRLPELAVAAIFAESRAHDYIVLSHRERGLHGYVLTHSLGPIDLAIARATTT